MFALRASCSSTLTAATRRPVLSVASAQLGRKAGLSTAPTEPTILDFLEPESETPPPPPVDEPPTGPTGRGYPRTPPRATTFSNNLTGVAKPRYRLHCKASRNNTMVMFTDPQGKCIAWFSGGSCAFKGANRASYEAGYQCAVKVFDVIMRTAQTTPLQLELYFSGFGQGRDAMKTAILATEGTTIRPMVSLIQDRTPIKIGGTRAPKARRL